MNLNRLMQKGRATLKDRWDLALKASGLYMLVAMLPQFLMDDASFIYSLIVAGPFSLGLAIFSLAIVRDEEAQPNQVFSGFQRFKSAFIANLLITVYVILWALLLIVPGVIAALSYAMTYFIMTDDETLTPQEAMEKSKAMMDGHKLDLFYLALRFFGLALLCVLTLGIGFLWFIPYAHVTGAHFYEGIRGLPVTTKNEQNE